MRRDVIAPHPMFVNFVRSLQFDLDVDWCHRVCSTVAVTRRYNLRCKEDDEFTFFKKYKLTLARVVHFFFWLFRCPVLQTPLPDGFVNNKPAIRL